MVTAADAGGDEATGGAPPEGLFRYVWRESRSHQLGLCALAAVVFPLTMAPLELQRRIIDHAIGGADLRLLGFLGAAYLTVVLLQGGLKYLLRFYRGVVSERAIRRLRQKLLGTEPERSASDDPDEKGRGRTVAIVAAEVERVGGFVGESLSEPTLQIGIFLSVLSYMLFVEPTIAIVSLGFFLPQLIFVPVLQRAVNRRARRKIQLMREVGELIVEPRDDRTARYRDRLDRIYRVRVQYFGFKFLIKFLNNLMNHLAPLSVLMVGGYLVIAGATTVGTLVAFISGFQRLADPSRELLVYYRLAAETQVLYGLIAKRLTA
jgi:ABC-type bacteriocin/lantibiotic exporter with double-glycine peptidase domain